jgi:pimeloyl-ACP methyl ester carboxylesterase
MSFFFSAQGDHAAFLRGAEGRGLGVETWTWHDGTPRRRILTTGGESLYTQPLPLGDGRVLVLRSGAGVHHLAVLAAGQDELNLGRIESRGLHLLPSPEPGTLAVARGLRKDGNAALWVIRETSPHLQAVPASGLPAGTLHGGHWLDDAGRTLGLDHHCDNRSRIIAVDLQTGAMAGPALSGARAEDYHLLMSDRRSGCFLAAANAAGDIRLGWGRWDRDDWRLTFPAELSSFDGRVTPLAIDPAGRRVAFLLENGLRSEIQLREPGPAQRGSSDPGSAQRGPAGHGTRLDLPRGTFLPAARWTSGGLHLVTSGPHRPANILTVLPDLCRHRTDADPAPPGGWATAQAKTLAGPAGPIEAVVYGGPRWRESERLLIALHGGPHAAWKLDFDPLFQDLAAAGVAVLAPNQRGSTGYGPAHRDAIRGAWGGPDLADIRYLAESVAAHRGHRLPPLMLFGVSYGAFLALLAAAAAPDLWSRCAVVSPFSSAASLYAEGSAGVRSFLRRLGALDVIEDDLGPRDLERLAGRITARLLIIHGTGDETIPVSQPRRITAALRRAGRRSGTEFTYRELAGGHDPLQSSPEEVSRRQVIHFLTQPASADSALGTGWADGSGRSS